MLGSVKVHILAIIEADFLHVRIFGHGEAELLTLALLCILLRVVLGDRGRVHCKPDCEVVQLRLAIAHDRCVAQLAPGRAPGVFNNPRGLAVRGFFPSEDFYDVTAVELKRVRGALVDAAGVSKEICVGRNLPNHRTVCQDFSLDAVHFVCKAVVNHFVHILRLAALVFCQGV